MTANKSPEMRREEIFDAALRCFNRKGYYETSVEDIASAVGISKGGIYHHFASKKDLFIQLFRARVDRYFSEVTASIEHCRNAAQRIRLLAERSGEIMQDNMDILRFCLEFVTMGSKDPEIREVVTMLYKDRVATLRGIIREGIHAGTLKDNDPESIARVLYFLSMGYFLAHFTMNPDYDPQVQHSINMKSLFKGLERRK